MMDGGLSQMQQRHFRGPRLSERPLRAHYALSDIYIYTYIYIYTSATPRIPTSNGTNSSATRTRTFQPVKLPPLYSGGNQQVGILSVDGAWHSASQATRMVWSEGRGAHAQCMCSHPGHVFLPCICVAPRRGKRHTDGRALALLCGFSSNK